HHAPAAARSLQGRTLPSPRPRARFRSAAPPALPRLVQPPDPHKEARMNRINLTGRLTRDPELVSLPDSETVVCRMRLAVDGMAPSRDTGYIDVSTFGKPGEAAASVLS